MKHMPKDLIEKNCIHSTLQALNENWDKDLTPESAEQIADLFLRNLVCTLSHNARVSLLLRMCDAVGLPGTEKDIIEKLKAAEAALGKDDEEQEVGETRH